MSMHTSWRRTMKSVFREPVQDLLGNPYFSQNPFVEWVHDGKMRSFLDKFENHFSPPMLIIENTNRCTAQCIICPHRLMKRKQGTMDFALYEKIIDEAHDLGVRYVQINATGEPLLDRFLVERIAYAKAKGIETVYLFTNGSLLSGDRAKDILESGLDVLKISMDDLSKEGYERARYPLKFEEVSGNVLNFLTLKKERGNEKPEVHIEVKSLEKDKRTLKSTPLFARLKGLAQIRIFPRSRIHDWAGQHFSDSAYQTRADRIDRKPCPRLWTDMNILWDGRVCLCCLDFEGTEILGDMKSDTLANVWRGDGLERVRQLHRERRFDEIELCKNCLERMGWWFV